MTATAFDTLRVAKRLREAGFSEAQAETVAEVMRETRDVDLAQLATKGDLREFELRMTVKMGTISVVVGGLILAAMRFLVLPH